MRLRNLNVALRAALFFALIIVLVFVQGVFAVMQMGKLKDSEKDVELNWIDNGGLTLLHAKLT